MRITSSLFCLLIFFFFNEAKSQVSFTLNPQACQNQSLSMSASSGTVSPLGFTWTSIPNGALFSNANSSLSTLSFTNSGTYTISLLVSSNSGTSASSKTIEVIPFPISALSALSQTICAPYSASLSVSGADSYTWFPTSGLNSILGSSVVASPSISTVYSVTGSSSLCGTSHLNFSVSVNSYPNISWATSTNSVCEGQTAHLSAFGALSYTWVGTSFSVGITQPTISVGGGSYTLVGSNGGSCSLTIQHAIVIFSLNCTGFEELESEPVSFNLFPIPISETLFISSKNTGVINIQILDVLGKVCFTKEVDFISSNPQEITLGDFPSGFYLVSLKPLDGSLGLKRLVKVK